MKLLLNYKVVKNLVRLDEERGLRLIVIFYFLVIGIVLREYDCGIWREWMNL